MAVVYEGKGGVRIIMNKVNQSTSREVIQFLLFAISINLLLGSCSILERIRDEGKEQQTNTRDETYSIDSSTLLESLKEGRKDAFILLTATPPAYPSPSTEPVCWTQKDFITINQALYSIGWQDNLSDWKLKDFSFGLKCSEIDYGPQGAGFNFFKTEQNNDKVVRVLRHLFIAANDNFAILNETEYYPEIEKWTAINMASISIPVEDALQIAEINGGMQFRKNVDNNCFINAEVNTGSDSAVWIISYSGLTNQRNELFRLTINAKTGEIIKNR